MWSLQNPLTKLKKRLPSRCVACVHVMPLTALYVHVTELCAQIVQNMCLPINNVGSISVNFAMLKILISIVHLLYLHEYKLMASFSDPL